MPLKPIPSTFGISVALTQQEECQSTLIKKKNIYLWQLTISDTEAAIEHSTVY